MKGRGLAGLLLAGFLVTGCGLETVETLAAPAVDFNNQELVTSQKLTLIHQSAPYTGSVFQGYYVYYKIYTSISPDFSRLQSDRDSLATSPTVDRLLSMGYRQLTASAEKYELQYDSPGNSQPLSFLSLSNGDVIAVDFESFLAAGSSRPNKPLATINRVKGSQPYLYRSDLLPTGHRSFWDLPTESTPVDTDVFKWPTSDIQTRGQELNVFIVAYGMTGTLQAVYSRPIAWGVIRLPPKF